MPKGLRAADAPTILRLCGEDRRLFMRVGALLEHRLALTEAVLGEVRSSDWLRDLIMDRRLRDLEPAASPEFLAERGESEDLRLVEDDGWRVLCWEDELGNPLMPEAATAQPRGGPADVTALHEVLPQASMDCRLAIEALLAADSDEERSAALEKIRYHLPPQPVLMELLPLVLGDASAEVRDRGQRLLVAAGAQPPVAALVAALVAEDEREVHRLRGEIASLADDQIDMTIAAAVAQLRTGRLGQQTVELLRDRVDRLARHPQLERILEQCLLHGRSLSLLPLVRGLQEFDCGAIDAILDSFLGRGDEVDARILALLLRPDDAIGADRARRAVELVISPKPIPRERMALAAALTRVGDPDPVIAALADRSEFFPECRDTALHWLLAEISRRWEIPQAAADRFLEAIVAILHHGRGTHVMAALEQRLVLLLPGAEDLRLAAIRPLGEIAGNTRDRRYLDLIAHNLGGLDARAGDELWQLIEEHPRRTTCEVAVRALGAALEEADVGTLRATVDRALARIPEQGGDDVDALLLATAARLACLPQLDDDSEPARALDRRSDAYGPRAIPAWSHLAAGPHLDPLRRTNLIERMLRILISEVEKTDAQVRTEGDDEDPTYVFDAALSRHTEWASAILAGLRRITTSPHLPVQLGRRIVDRLAHHFSRVARWETIWAPGNVYELVEVLVRICEREACPSDLRADVGHRLLERISNPHIAAQLARLLMNAGPAHLAADAAESFLDLVSRERFADEDQSQVATVLARLLMTADLGEREGPLRRRLAAACGNLARHVDERLRTQLRDRLPSYAEEIRARLDWLGEEPAADRSISG